MDYNKEECLNILKDFNLNNEEVINYLKNENTNHQEELSFEKAKQMTYDLKKNTCFGCEKDCKKRNKIKDDFETFMIHFDIELPKNVINIINNFLTMGKLNFEVISILKKYY